MVMRSLQEKRSIMKYDDGQRKLMDRVWVRHSQYSTAIIFVVAE